MENMVLDNESIANKNGLNCRSLLYLYLLMFDYFHY